MVLIGDSMALKTEQKTSHKQTAATIHLMNLMQMNEVELLNYIEGVMQENPVFDAEQLTGHDGVFRARRQDALKGSSDDDRPDFADPRATDLLSLYEDVCLQLDSLAEDKTILKATKAMASNLDEHGYLDREDFDLFSAAVGSSVADRALALLQSLTPAGIGARDLGECLCLQLRRLPEDTTLAEMIAENHLELLSKGHFQQISKLCGASTSDVRHACTLIQSLNPKPGSTYDSYQEIQYVVPDLLLDKSGNLSLNSTYMPKLRFSDYYSNLLDECTDATVIEYLNDKFQQAELLMNNLQRRSSTILSCMKAIMEVQKPFFIMQGKAALRPMTQAQLAQMTGLSESTISRVIKNKYIQCSFGTYPLSSFFSSGLGDDEQSVSSSHVKDRISALIESEDKTSPLSDQDISAALSREGISVSRRTVAKYRQQLNIPGVFSRKIVAE